ncbi:MAG: OmpA family protein [Chitinispirillales bacterium]|jgi:outer membrane protein OmpA-like peptidoglycan-associated protein|nr:OmpA family protein [Chitinispirillales bacterium]
MNMKITIAAALTALLCVSGAVTAQEGEVAVKRSRLSELEVLESKLDEKYSSLRKEGVAAATPMYIGAKGHIKSAVSIQPKPAKAMQEAEMAFTICSTHVMAVMMQFENEMNLVKARKMAAKRDSLLNVLNNIHEAISRVENGRAFKLSQELEATKGKAADLESNLSATQSNLKATQADLETAQANLAAERERLRQVMEDAQKRLKELQSDLINVSRDARGTIISMSDILFETGKANLTANLKTNLARIAGILMVYKEPNILVEGHTDSVGTRELNEKLSKDRAANVMNFIVDNGVEAQRLSAIGSAFDKPIADNSTKEGRAKNRRVDLIIMEEELDYGQKENAAE